MCVAAFVSLSFIYLLIDAFKKLLVLTYLLSNSKKTPCFQSAAIFSSKYAFAMPSESAAPAQQHCQLTWVSWESQNASIKPRSWLGEMAFLGHMTVIFFLHKLKTWSSIDPKFYTATRTSPDVAVHPYTPSPRAHIPGVGCLFHIRF